MLHLLTPSTQRTTSLLIAGQWRAVRLCLDVAAQEWLNVGVAFWPEGSRAPAIKLLENLSGVRCLYDDDAVDTTQFLLDQAEYALLTGADLPKGWNVSLSEPLFARGKNIEEVLDSLFSRMVTLSRHGVSSEPTTEDHPHSTLRVRTQVRRLLARMVNSPRGQAPDFWVKSPLPVERDQAKFHINLQVHGSTNTGQHLNACIASAWYKKKQHLTANIAQAQSSVTLACQAFKDSRNVAYILKPPAGSPSISGEALRTINEQIEGMKWLLEKNNGELVVLSSEREIAQQILHDLGSDADQRTLAPA